MAALEGRTEGSIAALQLAALSMRDRHDIAGFIAGFTEDAATSSITWLKRSCSVSPTTSAVSCWDVDPGPTQRAPLQCGHRPGFWGGAGKYMSAPSTRVTKPGNPLIVEMPVGPKLEANGPLLRGDRAIMPPPPPSSPCELRGG